MTDEMRTVKPDEGHFELVNKLVTEACYFVRALEEHKKQPNSYYSGPDVEALHKAVKDLQDYSMNYAINSWAAAQKGFRS